MKTNNKKIVISVLSGFMFAIATSITAYANSSWYWISKTRPIDILPFTIAGTLIIEILAIKLIPRIKKNIKVIIAVSSANIVSFILPFLIELSNPEPYPSWNVETLSRVNFGIVNGCFLLLTLFVEIPIVYFALQNETKHKKTLILTILGVNILTTILVGITESILCVGRYS
ncbi:MAG: hypothetical protein VZR54_02280 [Ruminococcus sp.]|nr:hypothetical protein [Ruminococcus sp.]